MLCPVLPICVSQPIEPACIICDRISRTKLARRHCLVTPRHSSSREGSLLSSRRSSTHVATRTGSAGLHRSPSPVHCTPVESARGSAWQRIASAQQRKRSADGSRQLGRLFVCASYSRTRRKRRESRRNDGGNGTRRRGQGAHSCPPPQARARTGEWGGGGAGAGGPQAYVCEWWVLVLGRRG